MLSCIGDHILQEFNTLFLIRFRAYKIAKSSQTKEGGGPQTDKRVWKLLNLSCVPTFSCSAAVSNKSPYQQPLHAIKLERDQCSNFLLPFIHIYLMLLLLTR